MFIDSNKDSSHCKFGACQKWEPAGRRWFAIITLRTT